MGQLVLQLAENQILAMKKYYADALEASPPGAIFRAKTSNAAVTAYRSGKILFQGKAPEAEAEKWMQEKMSSNHAKQHATRRKSSFNPPQSLFTASHIGSDEAGTGDYFGPITVACAYTSASNIPLLKQIGVKDSKALSDDTIRKLANDIIRMNIPYCLLKLNNPKYNQLQKRGWSQGKMKGILHQHAIDKLMAKIGETELHGILIDQFCEPDVYKRYIHSENMSLPDKTFFMTKAESHSIAVAAGSILARAAFLREMDRLSDEIGFRLPKGASDKVDRAIAEIIVSKGEQTLDSCAKVHFANTDKGKKLI